MSKKESKVKARKRTVERQQKAKRQQTFLIAGIVGLLVLATAVFSLFNSNSTQQEAEVADLRTAPEVGALAPDFELPNNSGELVRLSDYRGQPVVLSFMHTW